MGLVSPSGSWATISRARSRAQSPTNRAVAVARRLSTWAAASTASGSDCRHSPPTTRLLRRAETPSRLPTITTTAATTARTAVRRQRARHSLLLLLLLVVVGGSGAASFARLEGFVGVAVVTGREKGRLGTGLRRRCSGCLSLQIGRFGSRMRTRDAWHLVVWSLTGSWEDGGLYGMCSCVSLCGYGEGCDGRLQLSSSGLCCISPFVSRRSTFVTKIGVWVVKYSMRGISIYCQD